MAKEKGILHHGYRTESRSGTSRQGTPEIVVSFRVPYVSQNGAWVQLAADKTAHVHIYLSDAAWEDSCKKLEALGFNGDIENPEMSPDTAEQGVDLLLRIEEYQGQPQEKWELANWGMFEAIPRDRATQLAARYRVSKARPPVPTGRPAAPPAAVSQAPVVMRQPPPPRPAMAAPPSRPATPPVPQQAQAQGELQMPPTPAPEGTKDWAWDVFLNENAGEPDLTRWNAILATIGKPESQFTHEDWINVHREVLAQALPV